MIKYYGDLRSAQVEAGTGRIFSRWNTAWEGGIEYTVVPFGEEIELYDEWREVEEEKECYKCGGRLRETDIPGDLLCEKCFELYEDEGGGK